MINRAEERFKHRVGMSADDTIFTQKRAQKRIPVLLIHRSFFAKPIDEKDDGSATAAADMVVSYSLKNTLLHTARDNG